ncbi:energy-coupling factor ABC transporter ATP-binding protein [uncultured Tolumonas sp.]|uniref:energy-coupling factor ABC transporter ATP-binding protein n=1 Tax=uncultured Tolumonas sp. TaxID=263765 RepID=UPI00292CD11B|nr:energy-coupling factor ABC transporter ATP-binding protein [uncultured Tolumonas sp.]
MATPPLLNMQQLSVEHATGHKVLDLDSLTIQPGELIALLGHNGAGKSTLLQTINLLQPFSGMFYLFGHDVKKSDSTQLRRRCALVFQDNLLLNMSVYDNLACTLRFHDTPRQNIPGRIKQVLQDFGCEHLAQRYATELSGGEAQRVCLARAVIGEPELLLLDEPSSSLDVSTRREVIEKIRLYASAHGITTLLVSHLFTDVLNFAQRALILSNGQIIQDDAPEVVMRRPVDEQVARLVAMDNILPCHYITNNQISLPGNIEVSLLHTPISPISHCCLPGDAIFHYNSRAALPSTGLICFEAIVERIYPGIGSQRLTLNVNGSPYHARVPRSALDTTDLLHTCQRFAFHRDELHVI